ncbi:MAG TPA: cupin domain-containing protein [Opitutaceae bacterium]
MRLSLSEALAKLPLPSTTKWPEGVWDAQALAHGSMSIIVFAPRGRDYQTTHKQDELYIVVKGQGVLMIDDVPNPFVEGDALFVPANTPHRFSEFSDGLVTWAIFWGPEGGE